MSRVALTAVGTDQPGIVAALTGMLVDLGCNLEDSTMSVLGGQFAVLLVLETPDGIDAAAIETALAPVAKRLDLVVVVRPAHHDRPAGAGAGTGGAGTGGAGTGGAGTGGAGTGGTGTGGTGTGGAGAGACGAGAPPGADDGTAGEGTTFSFAIHGADRPGIVHEATTALARAGGNVVDLGTRLVGPSDAPTYVMTLVAGFAPGVDAEGAAAAVTAAVGALGVRCVAHRIDIDVL